MELDHAAQQMLDIERQLFQGNPFIPADAFLRTGDFRTIILQIISMLDSKLDQNLEAVVAWTDRDECVSPAQIAFSGKDAGVALGMNHPLAMSVNHQTADLVALRSAGRSAVASG